jgi:hypothetical protein
MDATTTTNYPQRITAPVSFAEHADGMVMNVVNLARAELRRGEAGLLPLLADGKFWSRSLHEASLHAASVIHVYSLGAVAVRTSFFVSNSGFHSSAFTVLTLWWMLLVANRHTTVAQLNNRPPFILYQAPPLELVVVECRRAAAWARCPSKRRQSQWGIYPNYSAPNMNFVEHLGVIPRCCILQ